MNAGEGCDADVLVVDDNSGDRRFIEEALRASRLDLSIHMTNTKDEALNWVYQRGEYKDAPEPAVILLDWNLSEDTGKEVVNAAKSADPHIPLLVMSGSHPEINDVKSFLSEADMRIEKPTDPEGYIEPLCSLFYGK